MKLDQANQTALRRCQVIEAQLKKLSDLVAKRKAEALSNKIPNWAYVGDLGHIQNHLGELHCLS